MFAATVKLRRTRPEVERPFAIPGGRWGIRIACGVGIPFSAATFTVGFIPPAGLPESSAVTHTIVLCVAIAFGTLAPLAISRWSRGRGRVLRAPPEVAAQRFSSGW